MKKTAAVLCAAVLTLSACGSGEDDEAKENIKAAVLEEEGTGITGGTEPTEEQAECISDGMVDEVGVEKLQEYDLLNEDLEINDDANPTDMEEGDADALAGVFVDCIDVEEMFAAQFGSGEDELPAEAQECIKDAIDEDAMKDGLSASFQGEEDEGFATMQEEMMACVMGGMPGAEE
jgi:hypothetical protein